jgi:DHA1 family multidrug resistance protein-like MFS transporter
LDVKRAIQVLLITIFTAMLGMGIINPIIPLYAESLKATMFQIGLLSSAWSISRLVFTAPVGRLSDTMSKRKIIAFGLSIYAIVSILYVVAWDFLSLVSIRLIHGIGSAMSMPIAMAYAGELAPEGEEGRYMGTMNLAMFSGMGLGPFIGGYLTDLYSINLPFYVMGGFTAISLLLTLFLLPDDKASRREVKRSRPSFRQVFSNRLLRAAFVYRVIDALARGSINSFLPLLISSSVDIGGLGLSASFVGIILSVGTFSAALLQQPFGLLADRYSKVKLILLGGLIGAFGFTLFPLANDFWGMLAARLIFSAGSSLGIPAITAIATIEGRDIGIGTTMSVIQSAMSVGNVVGPILIGVLIDLYGLKPVFYMGGFITLIGTFVFYFMQRGSK